MAGAEEAIDRIEHALGVLVRQTRSARFAEAVREGAGIHLDRASYLVLVAVGRQGPARLSDIAVELGVDVSTVSRQVAALEAKGLLVREPDPVDGRAVRLSLSEAGDALTDRLRTAWRATIAEALADWTPGEIDALAPLLERFATDVAGEPAAR